MVGTGAAAPSPPSGPPAGAWLLARTHRKHRRAQPPSRTSAPSRVTCRVDWIGPTPPPGTRAGPHTTDESETWLQAPGAKAGVRRTWVSASPPLAHGRRRRPRRYPARAARPGRGRGPGWILAHRPDRLLLDRWQKRWGLPSSERVPTRHANTDGRPATDLSLHRCVWLAGLSGTSHGCGSDCQAGMSTCPHVSSMHITG